MGVTLIVFLSKDFMTGSYMGMCKFDKNKITYTIDKNFNGDVVSATNITLSIKLYLCLMISDVCCIL